MKKLFLALLMVSAVVLTGCGNGNRLHVKGNLKNVGDTLLVFTRENQKNPQKVIVKNGAFEFDYELSEPTIIYLVEPKVMQRMAGTEIALVAVPGESAVLRNDLNMGYELGGSPFYEEFNKAEMAMEPVQKKQQALTQRCLDMMASGTPTDSVTAVFERENEALEKEMEAAVMGFIKANKQSEAAAAMVAFLPPHKMREGAALLADGVKNGRMKPFYQKAIDNYETTMKAEQQTAKLQAPGRQAPEIRLKDINGRALTLSSLRGKYVVLDFWGSWCVWCIKGFPKMKEYYNKYKGKFEILGIDCNETAEKWRAAVEEHQLPWLHVYNQEPSTVLKDYGVEGFPTKIIIDPQGKIVRSVVGEDPSFYTLLDELFG